MERDLTIMQAKIGKSFEEFHVGSNFHLIQKTERPRQNSLACFPRFRIPRFSACRRFHRWSFAWSSFQRVRRTSVLRKLDHANDHRRLSQALKRRAWVFKTEQQFILARWRFVRSMMTFKALQEESITSGESYLLIQFNKVEGLERFGNCQCSAETILTVHRFRCYPWTQATTSTVRASAKMTQQSQSPW